MSAEMWISESEVSAITGWSGRHVRRLCADGVLRTKKDERYTGRGVAPSLYAASSIPAEYQQRVLDFAVARAARESQALTLTAPNLVVPQTDQQSLPLFAAASATNERLLVPPDQEGEVRRRLEIIQPMLDWKAGRRPIILTADNAPIRNMDQLAAFLATQYDVSRATVWNWYTRFTTKGAAGLCDRVRSDKGQSRFFVDHPAAMKFILAKFAEGQGHYSDTFIFEALKREWNQMYEDSSRPPSLSTVRNFLAGVPVAIRDIASTTRQQHDQKNAPYIITDIARVPVNHIWVADHRIYDVITVNDCFDAAPRFAALRLWETCIEDMRSRVVVGSVWNVTPSSRTIASALRQAISRYGMPDIFYCDNGKDFRKIGGGWNSKVDELDQDGRVKMSASATNLLGRLGIKVKYCVPRHPQSKQVESYFSTVSKRFDVMFGRSYAGHKPSLRPDSCREAEKLHKQFEKGERQSSPFAPASYFVALHRQWTDEFNHSHAHGGRGMEGRAPLDVFNELLPPEKRRIPEMAQLEPLFWDRVERMVSNCIVKLDDFNYCAVDEHGSAAMYLANGSRVLVARDPNDIGNAIACNSDGQFLAYLQCQELVARGPESEDKIKAIQRFRARVFKAGKQYWNIMQSDVPTELEFLAERANTTRPRIVAGELPAPKRFHLAAGAEPATVYAEDIAEQFLQTCEEN